jgi:hypothetical protein
VARGGERVYLVCFVYLVYLVCLVCLVKQTNQINQMNQKCKTGPRTRYTALGSSFVARLS